MMINVFYGIMIPFLGTALGAACVFVMKKSMNETFNPIAERLYKEQATENNTEEIHTDNNASAASLLALSSCA